MPTVMTKKKKAGKQGKPTMFCVDFPRQNEVVRSPEYALRVSAPESVKSVDVCIDQGEWQPCRQAAGHWWYDWSGYAEGEHEVITRSESAEGRTITCEPHEFFVDLRPEPAQG